MSKPFLNRLPRPLQDLSTLLHRARGGYNEYAILEAIRRDPDRAMKRYGEVIIRQFSSWPCPLSMAVSLGASLVLVQELHTKFPNAIRDDRGRGWTPLHDACCFRAPYEVIQFLVEQYPLALEEDCGCGDTPLRVACSHNCDPDVVELLAERFPKAMILEDDMGRTPIFIARQMLSVYERIGRRNTYPEVIDLLLTLHSLLCRDIGTTDTDTDFDHHGEEALTMLTSVGDDDEKDQNGTYRTWALPENSGPTQVFHITIPQDVAPGREFRVNAANHTVRIRCPPQIKPGTRLQITMPTNPVVTENLLVMVRRDNAEEKREYKKKQKDSSSKGSFFTNLFWKSNSVPVDTPHSKWSSRVAPILRHRTSVLQRMEIPSGVVPPLLERVGEDEDDNLETMFRIVRERMDLFQGMMQNQGFKAEQEISSSFAKKKKTKKKSRRRYSSRRRSSVSLCSANETTPLQPGQVYFSTFLGIFLFLTVLAFNIGLKLGERWVETPNEPLIQRLNTAAQVDLYDVTDGLFGELIHPEVVLSALKGETSVHGGRVDHQPHDMTPTYMDFKSLSYGPTIYVNTDNQVEHYDNIAIQFNNTLNVPVQVRWIDIDGNSPTSHVWTIDPKSEIRQLTSPGHLFVLSVLLSTTSPLRNTFDFSSDPFTEESEPILFAYRPTKRLRSGFPHCVSIRYDTADAQQPSSQPQSEPHYIVETALMDPSNFDAMIVHASTFDNEVLTTQNSWGKHKLIRLQHIVWSIMQHPTVDKYRRLRMSSPSIRRWGIHVSPGAIGILQTLGFRFTTVVVTPPHTFSKKYDPILLEVESAAHNLATGPKVETYLVCDVPTEEDMHQFRRVAEILVLLESREERPRFATDLMGPPVPWQRVSRL